MNGDIQEWFGALGWCIQININLSYTGNKLALKKNRKGRKTEDKLHPRVQKAEWKGVGGLSLCFLYPRGKQLDASRFCFHLQ